MRILRIRIRNLNTAKNLFKMKPFVLLSCLYMVDKILQNLGLEYLEFSLEHTVIMLLLGFNFPIDFLLMIIFFLSQ